MNRDDGAAVIRVRARLVSSPVPDLHKLSELTQFSVEPAEQHTCSEKHTRWKRWWEVARTDA